MNEITFDNITLDEVETLVRFLSSKSKVPNIDINDVVEFIKTQENTKFYFDNQLSGCDEKAASYLWLDTGFTDDRKRPLFISLLNYHGFFVGHMVGDASSLMVNMAAFNRISDRKRAEKLGYFNSKYEKRVGSRGESSLNSKYKTRQSPEPEPAKQEKVIENRINEDSIKKYWARPVLDITKEVKKLLIINKWHSINGLDRYIKIIGTRLQQLVNAKKSQYYVLNKIQSAICNTGLLNSFGEDVYIMYRLNLSFGFYEPYKVIFDKTQYLSEGFTYEQSLTALDPITFFDDENHGLRASIEDINFNAHDWLHIIEERRDRFPEELKGVSDVGLISQLKQSLDIGLKLQKRDGSFARPIFSSSTGSVAWVLPFFSNADFMTEPELVLVIYKVGDFWQLKTILPYDDKVKDKMMDMSIYSRMW